MPNKPIDKLVDDFVEATKKQYQATLQGKWQEGNKQVKRLDKAFREIVKIGDEAREALLALVDDEDMAVASMAAAYSLKYNPERSIAALQRLTKDPGIIGFKAQQSLKHWEEGTWQLE